MMMEYITLAGFILAIFVAGVAVGRLVEKIERNISKKEDKEHEDTKKAIAVSILTRLGNCFLL